MMLDPDRPWPVIPSLRCKECGRVVGADDRPIWAPDQWCQPCVDALGIGLAIGFFYGSVFASVVVVIITVIW